MGASRSLTLSVVASVVWILGTAQAQQPALRFHPLAPCRIADTRSWANFPAPFGGPVIGAAERSFPILSSPCLSGVPSTVAAYSLNVSVSPWGFLGFVTIWPTGRTPPNASTLNSIDGRIKANAAIVPAGTDVHKSVSLYATDNTDVWLDINGYFVPASQDSTALAFLPLPPCRIADTRSGYGFTGPLGPPWLHPGESRSFPVLSSPCIPANSGAQAYSLNVTVQPWASNQFPYQLGYLSLWPTGTPLPNASTLNALKGPLLSAHDQNVQLLTANAAIVPAGNNGEISAYVSTDGNTDLIIDINGYFALPTQQKPGLSLYTLPPCRVLDTRITGIPVVNTLTHDTTASPCGLIPEAQAVVLNATVLPWHHLGFLTLWPEGQPQPNASTLNAMEEMNTNGYKLITSNMAIVPTTSGVISAYASPPDITDLVLDTSGYFASGTAPAPTTYVLTVAKSGTGTGTVTSLDNKFNCGAVCAVSYLSGTVVTLTASAASGSIFAGWSGAGCSGTGTCTVTVTSALSVTAVFNTIPSLTGNWEFDTSSLIFPGGGGQAVGSLKQDGFNVTGDFQIVTSYPSTCFPPGTRLHVTGLFDTSTNSLCLTSDPVASQVMEVCGTVNSTFDRFSAQYPNGGYIITGGCASGDAGNVSGFKLP